ncbi:MAG: hypothetical protein JWO23_992 [Solirubrobacterales bacterium]|nr:hypothetical protein [Solirubrobacterales bacterium]
MRGMRGALVGLVGRRRRLAFLAVVVAASVAALGSASSAGAASFQKEFLKFGDCPYSTPGVTECVISTVTGGEFHIGSNTVPINKTIVLQGGINGKTKELVSATDGNTLSKTALTLPGGLLGIELLGNLLEVTVTAELAGPVHIFVANLGGTTGPAVDLPLKVKLDDTTLHLLGPSCYIGSESGPMTLSLTDGVTNPPPPNQPISGKPGNLVFEAEGRIVGVTENSLVDNAFSAPGVNGCAGILSLVVDPSVDLKAGLPSAAGKNTAIMNGSFLQADARIVKTETEIPEWGHCVKVVGVKEGKTTTYSGKFSSANCVTEAVESFAPGKYEWVVGPGPHPKFAGTGEITSFETVGKTKVLCSSSASNGEYTGPKTEKVSFTFSGCESTSLHTACQSNSAAAGEIRSSPLVGELGYINDVAPLKPIVGLDFKPESGSEVTKFDCGGLSESIAGSVIGSITPLEAQPLTAKSTLKFKAAKGIQAPEQFEELPTDVLSTTLTSGAGTSVEQSGLTGKSAIVGEEPLEIKARAF